MGYLLDQMEKVAYFAEEALMEKIALTREQAKAKRKAAKAANKAGRLANKAVAGSMQGGNLAQAASQLGVGVDEVAGMTPHNIARTLEKGQGKPLLKAVQEAVKGGGSAADIIPHAPGAGYEDLQNMLKSREGIINSLAGARDDALAKVTSLTGKVDAVRAHGANRARNLIDELRWQKGLKDNAYKELRMAKDEISGLAQESSLLNRWLERAHNANDALKAEKSQLSQQAAKLTDDLDNFKNLGRFSGVAKWIKGNPKKALGAAILGGGGLLGGAGAAGYAMNDGE
jgi:hypothetical protein